MVKIYSKLFQTEAAYFILKLLLQVNVSKLNANYFELKRII